MTVKTLTSDRKDGLVRVAVWAGKTLEDIYLDKIEAPDLTGAIVRGKAVRVVTGGLKAWFDAGMSQRLYVETNHPLKAGEFRVLRIRSTRGQGKAWPSELVGGDTTGEVGLIAPPPAPWLRALLDLKEGSKVVCHFESREDERSCRAYLETCSLPIGVDFAQTSHERVHPQLDTILDELLEGRFALRGGGEIVIEPTEALIAIDVNAGESNNPTAVNLEAARDIARRLRLGNMSGTIVIDALKMASRADTSKVLNALERALQTDPAQPHVFGMTKLGLIELTRMRRGPSLHEVWGK